MRRPILLIAALTVMMLLAGADWSAEARQRSAPPAGSEPITFSKHIAPIVFSQCGNCHRPGGAGPFPLLTYEDVKARAQQIARVTESRFMPPWKPEPGYGEFAGARRLSDDQVALFRRWTEEGMMQGDPAALPPLPQSSSAWRLGEPDLVVSMPEPYTLRADGPDMFRAFVLPIPIAVRKYIRAWEFRPGNNRVVHHSTMEIDTTDASRRLDEQDPEPGFEGLVPFSARFPEGYFLGWEPGHSPSVVGESMAWPVDKDNDLVMMLHLRPSGRRETVQASIGLYFSTTPPTRMPALVRLTRQSLDIPPGEKYYHVTDSYTLPVDVDVYSVQPHAHYLAREVKAVATLPDGTIRWLLFIKDWDFNWQDVYRFVTPVFLPAGSTVAVEWIYDNSAENVRNPQNPPRRVTYGQQTSDEMCELRLQVMPRSSADRVVLTRSVRAKTLPEDIAGLETMLKANPDSVELHDNVALLYVEAGNFEQSAAHFRESLRLRPESAAAHYNLGKTLLSLGKLDEAGRYLRRALAINPDHANAHRHLGVVLQLAGKLEDAARHYSQALRLAPNDAEAHHNLGAIFHNQGKVDEAIARYREALRINPAYADAHYNLAAALQTQGNVALAVQHYREALRSRPDWPPALTGLASVLATAPATGPRDAAEAVRLAERAAALTRPQDVIVLEVLATALAAAGQFDRAATTAEAALARARATQDEATITRILQELELYRQQRR